MKPPRQRVVQFRACFRRQGGRLGIAIDLNCLLRCIDYETAVLTLPQVLLDRLPKSRIEILVQVISQLFYKVLTLHVVAPRRK